MRIEDRFTVEAPRERVWTAIRDPAVVGACVPGCLGVTVVSPTSYKARIHVELGPIKADFNVDVDVVAETPPEEVRSRTRGEEGGRASAISADNVLRLASISDTITEVYYCSQVSVVGRLGKFGFGVMTKKAQSLGREFATALKQRVEHKGSAMSSGEAQCGVPQEP